MPRAIVSTRAYHAIVGYQIRGSSRVHWRADYTTTGRHKFNTLMKVRRHRAVTIRLWVKYMDATGYATTGAAPFTKWKTFRRP